MKFLMFHLNRIKYLILIFLFIAFIPNVKAIVSPTKDFYVNDYANILSSETKQYIMNKSIQLNNVDGTQIVVVTVPNLEGYSIEDYALRLFREFGIGDKTKNNGLLLLLAYEERLFRVEVGYGLEGILPDGKTGRFQDEYIIPYLRVNNWNDGIRNGYDAFFYEIVRLNNLDLDYVKPNLVGRTENTEDPYFLLIIVVGLICGFISRILYPYQGGFNKLYFLVWIIGLFATMFIKSSYVPAFMLNLFAFLMGRFMTADAMFSSSSSGGFSSGGSSFGGYSGGGGSSIPGRF